MISDVIHFFDPLWITFSVIWFELHHLTLWNFAFAIGSFLIASALSSSTEETAHKFIWSVGGIALFIVQIGQNQFLTSYKIWLAFGMIIPHIFLIQESIITLYKILIEICELALVLFTWTWATLFKLFQWIVWLIVTIGHFGIWTYYTGKNTIDLINLFRKVNFYKVIYKNEKTPEFTDLRSYFEWYKNNWQAQRDTMNRDYNREWYMGKRFYYENAEPSRTKKNNNQRSNQSSSGQKQSNDNSQNNGKKDYEEAYEKYKRDNGYTNQQQQKSSEEKKYKDEYTQFYSSSYFVRLGISTNASFKEIQKAYRDLVQKYHPDKDSSKTKEYTEITQKLNEAYDYFRKQQRKSA